MARFMFVSGSQRLLYLDAFVPTNRDCCYTMTAPTQIDLIDQIASAAIWNAKARLVQQASHERKNPGRSRSRVGQRATH